MPREARTSYAQLACGRGYAVGVAGPFRRARFGCASMAVGHCVAASRGFIRRSPASRRNAPDGFGCSAFGFGASRRQANFF